MSEQREKKIIIIGGGLAGVEAAYQAAKRGIEVDLYEMRSKTMTEAHTTPLLGELVCSNSLGADQITSGSGLLKEELKMMDSFFLRIGEQNRVPAGGSFAVDRIKLAEQITREIKNIPNINLIEEEVKAVPRTDHPVIIATGPLTSGDFAQSVTDITMRRHLHFYDATSPIIDAQSIDYDKVYRASRYDKGDADFLNIPLNEEQYKQFVTDLLEAEKVEFKDLEKNMYFDACLPVEEIANRGEMTLAFGPLKPVGLEHPETGKRPFAVIQLRQDDLNRHFYQMVGFQTRLKYGEQKRIFRTLPGLEKAEFERYGRMHRNSYINAPLVLDHFYKCKLRDGIYFAGQLSGVEGYVESVCSGMAAGIFAAKELLGEPLIPLPQDTASGALVHYITNAGWKDFKPTKFTFGLLPEVETKGMRRKGKKKMKKEIKSTAALESLKAWISKAGI